jgi:hypothetical protein
MCHMQVSSDVFIGLLKSPNPTVKAAAASAYTKQGLAAKASTPTPNK